MAYVEFFRELDVYSGAQGMEQGIFELSKTFPKEEKYSLTDQIRRSSRSIGAQIAEAWARRRYEKHFVAKLTDACGELFETQHWILSASNCRYVSTEVSSLMIDKNFQHIKWRIPNETF